ncbi:MAG: YcxB family protein [Clostridiales bacterium]|nr:YcxB family protein [Candidatus Crickella equi]
MFINEYEMTRKRFLLWSTPRFYKLPIFYIWAVVFIFSGIAWWYFANYDVEMRWQTLAAFMMLISFYRGVAFRYMAVDKQYRLTKENMYKGVPWMCKVEVNDGGIRVSANGKIQAYVKWDRISEFVEADSFLDLRVKDGDQARLDKACFTKGNTDEFKAWMKENHPDIPYKEMEARYNR